MKKIKTEIVEYDRHDTTGFIDASKPLRLRDIGFELPEEEPTKVVSIRLPTKLYNQLKSFSTSMDIPYQAYIKYLLARDVRRESAMNPLHRKHPRGRRSRIAA